MKRRILEFVIMVIWGLVSGEELQIVILLVDDQLS
jgi:hypothetical protein